MSTLGGTHAQAEVVAKLFVLTDREPITLRDQSGIRLEGLRIAGSPSIVLERCRDVVIARCDLRSIRLNGCENVTVINSYLHDAPQPGVDLDDSRNVRIQGNRFERVSSGVYAHQGSGIRVIGNLCIDVQGPMPRGQLAQFNQVTGAGNEIAYNHAINHAGKSTPEDLINLHQSTGTPESWIEVHHNILLGDPLKGSEGKSRSGSGIMLGDGGGGYQRARYNLLLNPGQVGIGIAGGADIEASDNRVRGDRSNISNVGIYAWNQYPDARPVGPVRIQRNQVFWVNADDQPNHYWDGGGFTSVDERDNQFGDESLLRLDPATLIDGKLPPMPDPDDPRFSWDAANDTTGLGGQSTLQRRDPPMPIRLKPTQPSSAHD